jgi:hypothetical protein
VLFGIFSLTKALPGFTYLLTPSLSAASHTQTTNCFSNRSAAAYRERAACDGVQACVSKECEASCFPHKRGVRDGAAVCRQQLHLAHLDHKDLLDLQSNKHQQGFFSTVEF